jgi:hypothetical protein
MGTLPGMLAPAGRSAGWSRVGAVGGLWAVGGALVALYLLAFALRFPLARHYQRLGDIASLSGGGWAGAAGWLASLLAAFGLYALGWRLARRAGRSAVGPVLAIGAAAALALAFMYPVTAIDQYVYLIHGRIWALHHGNPLVQPPSAFPTEPLLGLTGEFAGATAPYGPLWIVVSGAIARLAGDDLLTAMLLFKIVAVASYLACAGLIALILGRSRPADAAAGTLLFAWNPVVLIDVAGNGHNDATMMALALGAIALRGSRWRAASPALLCLAALVKYLAGALVPLLLVAIWRDGGESRPRLVRLAAASLLCLVATAPLLWPFWAGAQTLDALVARNSLVIGSPAALALFGLHQVAPELGAERVKSALIVALIGVYLVQLWRVWRGRTTWLSAGLTTTLAAIAAVAWFNSWFLVWPLALAALLPSPRAGRAMVVFTLTALVAGVALGHRGLWPGQGWTFEQAQAIGGALTFLPFAAAWLGLGAAGRRGVRPAETPVSPLGRRVVGRGEDELSLAS